MRTRIADDYDAIRTRLDEMSQRPATVCDAVDIEWVEAEGRYWYYPVSEMGRLVFAGCFRDSMGGYPLGERSPEKLSAAFTSERFANLVFQQRKT